jgi:crotonobetainyl-CoA:carnitine CoA-transferase CaiB-like acyl-CoA transferase
MAILAPDPDLARRALIKARQWRQLSKPDWRSHGNLAKATHDETSIGARMIKPLTGTLVVSLDQAVAAPLTARRLADAGARVIKLERPEGDFARYYDAVVRGQCTHFVWLNRGKQSVVADLTKPEDRRLFEALVAKADVLLQNLKPGALAKLGYPTEALCRGLPCAAAY